MLHAVGFGRFVNYALGCTCPLQQYSDNGCWDCSSTVKGYWPTRCLYLHNTGVVCLVLKERKCSLVFVAIEIKYLLCHY